MIKMCTSCIRAVLKNYGWSDYTVEGTSIFCSSGLNPELPRDRGWVVSEEDKKVFAFAETCDAFQEGPPDSHPVECDCASGNSGCVY
jgi:hypothetical protein